MNDESDPAESPADRSAADSDWKRRRLLGTAATAATSLIASPTAILDGESKPAIPGRIEAKNFDADGSGVAFTETTPGDSGGTYHDVDVDVEIAGDDYDVGWTDACEWRTYSATVDTAGTYEVTAKVASGADGGTFVLQQGRVHLATFEVPDTGGWQSWTTITKQVHLDAGDHVIAISLDTAGVNLDWLDFSLAGSEGAITDPYPGLDDTSWRLTWNDEFDQGSIDTSTWTFEVGGGCGEHQRHDTDCTWGNREEQYYTDGDNAWLQNDRLVIEARAELAPNGENPYTSTRLNTAGGFETQYGRIDVRARLPETQGLWPAIWMLGHDIGSVGWPDCGEVDVMELLGHDVDTVHGTVHGPGYSGSGGINDSYSGPDFSNGFHDFTVTWYPDAIKWFVDGSHYHTVTQHEVENAGDSWVFRDEFFVVLNVAVGGRFPGYPDSATQLPQRMEVEYVRVWDWV
ncbi:glucan endo-1,3-beta-D-glucosidase [Salinarchaeum sp. Harcht-Bsk1]|uniref:family 16 glycosylhydrolase n=1 Tax=Salinarchaeum sp. Harcht-Bsk1 TaxID=1333523 RepID=UPI0003423D5A|nr:family 16 glycosylhydrolase [Salinarchaeum sp. Harcht-Bsk1]AGN00345.1 glucan endo-1,3-beta-D-glucosidase [Salinarchaeum sp. Harcht-Bsk1]